MLINVILNVLTAAMLMVGLFFLLVGALGVWRLPDLYHRMIAASKCITLGISGMLVGSVLHFATVGLRAGAGSDVADPSTTDGSSAAAAATKALLVIVFQFVAAPVAAHMLARAAHIDGVPLWEGTLSDDLTEDRDAARKRTGESDNDSN